MSRLASTTKSGDPDPMLLIHSLGQRQQRVLYHSILATASSTGIREPSKKLRCPSTCLNPDQEKGLAGPTGGPPQLSARRQPQAIAPSRTSPSLRGCANVRTQCVLTWSAGAVPASEKFESGWELGPNEARIQHRVPELSRPLAASPRSRGLRVFYALPPWHDGPEVTSAA